MSRCGYLIKRGNDYEDHTKIHSTGVTDKIFFVSHNTIKMGLM